LNNHLRKSDIAMVITPLKLTRKEEELATKLAQKLMKTETLKVEFSVDPEILDGMKLKYKDKLWDMSLSGQLDNMLQKINV